MCDLLRATLASLLTLFPQTTWGQSHWALDSPAVPQMWTARWRVGTLVPSIEALCG